MSREDVFDAIYNETILASMTLDEFAEVRRWWTYYALDGPKPHQFWETDHMPEPEPVAEAA